MECYYCHKKGYVRKNCEELTKHLEATRNKESKETLDSTNVVDEGFESEYNVLSVITNENFSNSWILNSGCSFYMCAYNECFDTYRPCDVGTILMGDDSRSKAIGIGIMKVKMFDGVVRRLSNMRHVPKLRRIRGFRYLGYDYSSKDGMMTINKDALVAMKVQKVRNLYKLVGKTILGGAAVVEPHHERFLSNSKEVARVKGCSKMMHTLVADEGCKHKEEINCRRLETLRNGKKSG